MGASFVLRDRSDRELFTGIEQAVTRERENIALVIAHLAEMHRRRLFAEEAFSSLSKYCIEVLHMSEWQAYRRMDVAKLAQQFPIVLDMLADGLVHFTAVHRLGPSLTEENHREVLQEAVHKSREQIEEIVARLRPKPPMPSMVRKLPAARPEQHDEGNGLFQSGPGSVNSGAPRQEGQCPFESGSREPLLADRTVPPAVEATPVDPPRSRKAVVSPLAPELYKIQFTADAETYRMLRQLQELMRHQIPNGDPAEIVKRGLERLLDHVKEQKFADVKRPRKQTERKKSTEVQARVPAERRVVAEREARAERRVMAEEEAPPKRRAPTEGAARKTSRHIPAEVKREVWERDEGRCAFVSRSGRRCSERSRIEYHHIYPFGLGGEATASNISLRCRTHNAYEGELIFGEAIRKNGERAVPARTHAGASTS